MLQFTKNEYTLLAHKTLSMWISLLSAAERAQRGQTEETPLPLECVAAVLDTAGKGINASLAYYFGSNLGCIGCLLQIRSALSHYSLLLLLLLGSGSLSKDLYYVHLEICIMGNRYSPLGFEERSTCLTLSHG